MVHFCVEEAIRRDSLQPGLCMAGCSVFCVSEERCSREDLLSIGPKYQHHKGDNVRMTATVVNGSATALFINTLLAN
jgi:hypothetical protein